MSASERWGEDSALGSLLPSLQGLVEAVSNGRLPANLASLHEFLDNDLQPSLRVAGLRCRALEPSEEHGSFVTLLKRDISDINWYSARIGSALPALALRNATYFSPDRWLVALFERLLSVVGFAATTEVEIGTRPGSGQVSGSEGVNPRREEP
jgi:hypothetical protein